MELTYVSPDSEEGYPGDLAMTVSYTLTNDNELKIEMTATTDKPAPVDLAHHFYWNLAGHASGYLLGQQLTINADIYTPINDQLIPTGEIQPVKGMPYDFTQPTLISKPNQG